MARESKQERIIRTMSDQLSEHLHELQMLAKNPASKELDVERWVQSVMRSCLGYSASAGYTIRSQETRGKMRPDLIVLKADKPVLIVEVKKLDFNLEKAAFRSGKTQLGEYLNSLEGVHWGILSNGFEWKLYDFSNTAVGGIEINSFDLRLESESLDLSKRGVEDASWNMLDLHETNLASGAWTDFAKEATAFSPDSLAKAILSTDVVRYIARAIRGEHEYKANTDVLIDKIAGLVEKGLDDQDKDWNDAKKAELNKYIKGQKKASRKKKKARPDLQKAASPAGDETKEETDVVAIDQKQNAA